MNIFTPVSTCRTGITVEWFPLKYFVESLSRRYRRVIACGILDRDWDHCCVQLLALNRSKMKFQRNIRIIFLKNVYLSKNCTIDLYPLLIMKDNNQFISLRTSQRYRYVAKKKKKISLLKISTRDPNISSPDWRNWKIRFERKIQWHTLAPYFVPSLISHHPGVHGGNKEEGNARDLVARKPGANSFPRFYR